MKKELYSTHHLHTNSLAYNALLTEILASNHGARVRTELDKKGFPVPSIPESVA